MTWRERETFVSPGMMRGTAGVRWRQRRRRVSSGLLKKRVAWTRWGFFVDSGVKEEHAG